MPRLRISTGPLTGTAIDLYGDRIDIGSGEDVIIQVLDDDVEPIHASLAGDDGGFLLSDHDSQLGTYVNGKRIVAAKLRDGDQISIGEFLATYEADQVSTDGATPPVGKTKMVQYAMAGTALLLLASVLATVVFFKARSGGEMKASVTAAEQRGPAAVASPTEVPGQIQEQSAPSIVQEPMTTTPAQPSLSQASSLTQETTPAASSSPPMNAQQPSVSITPASAPATPLPASVPETVNSAAALPTAFAAETPPITSKASKIIIPKVAFRDATVNEGVDFVRTISRQLDPDNSGVTIILVASEETKSKRVDLDLINVSVSDAVKYLAIAAGLEMTRDGEAIVLRKKSDMGTALAAETTPDTTKASMTRDGDITILGSFNGANGKGPNGSLTVSGSMLYGMTAKGGANNDGTIFSIPLAGGTVTTLASFNGTNGVGPGRSLTPSGSMLYGMTNGGGVNQKGTIFSIPLAGGTITTLASFNGTNGQYPLGSLIAYGSTLYGMTQGGGANTDGTIFSIPLTGGTFTTLASFNAGTGSHCRGSLTLSGATLYGLADRDGAYGYGTVFGVPLTGGSITTLASFNSTNGAYPVGSLTVSGSMLYGMTAKGGANNDGTIFSIPLAGGTVTTLASFNGNNGQLPYGSLTLSGSTLYGTTSAGGANNDGTIFSIPLAGGTITTLASFNGTNGQTPYGDVTISADGSTLYATANGGGANSDGSIVSINLGTAPSPNPTPPMPQETVNQPSTYADEKSQNIVSAQQPTENSYPPIVFSPFKPSKAPLGTASTNTSPATHPDETPMPQEPVNQPSTQPMTQYSSSQWLDSLNIPDYLKTPFAILMRTYPHVDAIKSHHPPADSAWLFRATSAVVGTVEVGFQENQVVYMIFRRGVGGTNWTRYEIYALHRFYSKSLLMEEYLGEKYTSATASQINAAIIIRNDFNAKILLHGL